MDEFDLIATYFAPLAGPEGLNLSDDAALYTPPPGYDLVLTKDAMVEGVHFPNGDYGAHTAGKLLRVNLSDLAAKGASPIGYLLAIAVPEDMEAEHLSAFAEGLRDVQTRFDFHLFGGDTVRTPGPMTLSATLLGLVPEGRMIRRRGAQVGDDIWVTGTIGDAYLGLQQLMGRLASSPSKGDVELWQAAYYRPSPRLSAQDLLLEYATAAADISDGLVADISHICMASGIGAKIEIENMPLSAPTREWVSVQADPEAAWLKLATAGDDYEIAFTANPKSRVSIRQKAQGLGLGVTRIGSCKSGEGVQCYDTSGQELSVNRTGYSHFQEKTR